MKYERVKKVKRMKGEEFRRLTQGLPHKVINRGTYDTKYGRKQI